MGNLIRWGVGLINLVLILSSCSDQTIESAWNDNDIIIDGNINDWGGSLKYFEDEQVAIGVLNDKENIFFCLTTSDMDKITKIMRTGLTIWLDPQSSDGETFGIQYPIRKIGSNQESMQHKRKMQKDETDDEMNIQQNMLENFIKDQNEILIVNEDKFPLNAIPIENNTGLEAKIGTQMHQMVYELKIPLANNDLGNVLFVDALPNEIVKVGFETGEMEKMEKGERAEMGQGSAGMSGGGTRGGRGGMRGGGRGNISTMKDSMAPIEFWIEVKLASGK